MTEQPTPEQVREVPWEQVGRGVRFYVDATVAQTPASGECVANSWWTVCPERGLAFYAQLHGYGANEPPSPQCNSSESTARLLCHKLSPANDVKFFPAVFMRHADRALAALRAHEGEK